MSDGIKKTQTYVLPAGVPVDLDVEGMSTGNEIYFITRGDNADVVFFNHEAQGNEDGFMMPAETMMKFGPLSLRSELFPKKIYSASGDTITVSLVI